jgi:hypothetical protein
MKFYEKTGVQTDRWSLIRAVANVLKNMSAKKKYFFNLWSCVVPSTQITRVGQETYSGKLIGISVSSETVYLMSYLGKIPFWINADLNRNFSYVKTFKLLRKDSDFRPELFACRVGEYLFVY